VFVLQIWGMVLGGISNLKKTQNLKSSISIASTTHALVIHVKSLGAAGCGGKGADGAVLPGRWCRQRYPVVPVVLTCIVKTSQCSTDGMSITQWFCAWREGNPGPGWQAAR